MHTERTDFQLGQAHGVARFVRALIVVSFAVLVLPMYAQQPVPAPVQQKSVLITGGTVHVGDGRVIDEGAVGFRDGRIDYVGYAYGVKAAYDTII
ncbi:MAG: hypothetical protein ACK6A5_17900, partial [Flavobacteriales bacterium]